MRAILRYCFVVLGIMMLTSLSTAVFSGTESKDDKAIQHLMLHYVLHWKGLSGKATYSVEQLGSHYTIRSSAQGSGLASILGKVVMTSAGDIDTENRLHPHFFRLDKPFGHYEQATFDNEGHTVKLKDGRVVPVGETVAHDPLSLLFQFYWSPPHDQLKHVTLVTTKKVATYIFKLAGSERLMFNNKPIDTQVWKRYDEDGELEMTMWLAPSKRYLPIKMHDYDGPDDIRELVLTSIDNAQ